MAVAKEPGTKRSGVISGLLLAAASCLVALIGGELALRRLVGVPLPPLRIVNPAGPSEINREAWYSGLVVDGKKITVGDLWGYHRPDPVLAYTIKENTISVNGWWQSNNIGARSRSDTGSGIPKGKKRFLLFGESFGEGTRVRQENAWASQLQALDPGLEVVNLAVDGFSMAQAYRRYLSFKDRLEHNSAVMMFVPEADLWRDVNTVRDLAANWSYQAVQPRFVIENKQLKFVPSPYADPSDVFLDNRGGLSERLRDHLRRYDRFYFRSLYETPPVIGRLWIYKLAASDYGRRAKKALLHDLKRPGSEAMQVSHEIFRAMQAQAENLQTQFALIILPTSDDLRKFRADPRYVETWHTMTESICAEIRICIDLSLRLQKTPPGEIDSGYDGTHYGPGMSHKIAEAVFAEFARRGLL